ncbi:hypothetical protein [Mucilaginibacter sp. CSA2-8R]|uniref:hypothetical protein n=1 Tax=Mucilaginibacter sp. CSA2-8R TaxID=3141542 RepID=UPI00315CDA76
MIISDKLDDLHARIKHNRWMYYFWIFCRFALAAGFLPSGYVKIIGERFTSLSNNHPMGHYLEALHHTGFYYTFIGVVQMMAALLLLFRRTALLGAILYFPIILNICLLSIAVRFDGSLISSPLMVLANAYLLCWDYDRIKPLLPFRQPKLLTPQPMSNRFPTLFFAGVFTTMVAVIIVLTQLVFDIRPRNTDADCRLQCRRSKNQSACEIFCDDIHREGKPLEQALESYHQIVGKK